MSNQPSTRFNRLQQVLLLLAAVLVFKVTAAVVWGYRNYLPPNFGTDFLHGRQGYFYGTYQWAFYTHIGSGPIAMVVGTILISERFRMRFPKWHRRLGRIQVANVLLLVSPSGLWMARYAQAGTNAATSFSVLALLTGACAALGWRAAVERRFVVHRRWMWRCYLLLCSAVILRMLGGLATVSGAYGTWVDPLISWASWIAPLAAFEFNTLRKNSPLVFRFQRS